MSEVKDVFNNEAAERLNDNNKIKITICIDDPSVYSKNNDYRESEIADKKDKTQAIELKDEVKVVYNYLTPDSINKILDDFETYINNYIRLNSPKVDEVINKFNDNLKTLKDSKKLSYNEFADVIQAATNLIDEIEIIANFVEESDSSSNLYKAISIGIVLNNVLDIRDYVKDHEAIKERAIAIMDNYHNFLDSITTRLAQNGLFLLYNIGIVDSDCSTKFRDSLFYTEMETKNVILRNKTTIILEDLVKFLASSDEEKATMIEEYKEKRKLN